mgnify:CR=1 FL=1
MREFDYSTVKHYKLYGFIKKVFAPAFKWLYRLEFKGLENVPPQGTRYIVAINHTCAFDPVFVSIPKKVPALHFMAKAELFSNPIAGWFIKHMYGFPVNRGKGDTSAIDYGEKIIEEGHVMAICPEGRRVKDKDGVPQKAKAGVAVIAKAAKAPVLPVSIYNREDMKRGSKITVRFGELIPYEELGFTEEGSKTEEKAVAAYIMERIVDLWRLGHCE